MKRERKNNMFKHVPTPNVRRNLFDLSHEVKMSGKFGYLYPILCMDTLPGDTIREQMSVMVRFAPMLAPIMHRVDVRTHFFFVPNRLLSDAWQEFITGGQDGLSEKVLPYVTAKGLYDAQGGPDLMVKGTIWDYLGLPVASGTGGNNVNQQRISVLPFRAIAKVWNDFYRDPNFDEEFNLHLNLEGNVSEDTQLSEIMVLKRYRAAWEKDYFTSALPFAQRGAQVLMPLAGTLDIDYYEQSHVMTTDGWAPVGSSTLKGEPTGDGHGPNLFMDDGGTPQAARIENIESAEMDATTTINDLRRALAIQRWLEVNARGGARYIEQIEGHFNVRVPDYRLQRAEYLGGGKQPVQISEVLTTAEGEVPVGDMAGHGLSVGSTNSFTYRCEEHGWVVGFLTVIPRTAYQNGIAKFWLRQSRFDFGWPELANLGEQEIKQMEVNYDFMDSKQEQNEKLFGYIPRYAEYKFMNDRVAGDFRDTLDFWHLGRYFGSNENENEVVLDEQFTSVYEDLAAGVPGSPWSLRRIFAVQDGTDYLWMQLYHRLTAKRPLPYFGVPSIM